MKLCLCVSLLLVALQSPRVLGYPQQKAKVVSNSEITALSDKSDTAKANVVSDGEVKTNYQGKGGFAKNAAGDVKATQQGKGDKFNAVGPDGKTATGTVDKTKKTLNAQDAKGNKIVADATDNHNVDAVVNGKDKFDVVRDDSGNADVYPKNANKGGKPTAHVKNLRDGTDNIVVQPDGKPERVDRLKPQKAGGTLTNVDATDAENTVPGIPIGNKNSAKLAYQGSSKSDIQIGKSLGVTNNDALSVGAAAEVQSDSVDTKPCYSGEGGKDVLEAESGGIKIDQKSIRFELIKDASGSYAFPSCFNAFANVFIPAGVDVDDLSAHSKITAVLAGGEMQCDPKVSCKDRSTANRPTGSCFFCDFCKKDQPQGAFGIGTEANICDAKAGQTLPLKWKLCPPEGSGSKFVPFVPGGKADGDIVAVLRLFLRKSTKWTEVACKQSIYSFKVGLVNGPKYGNKKDSAGRNTQGGKFGNLFGGR